MSDQKSDPKKEQENIYPFSVNTEGVVDLNVMTRRGRFGARVAALRFTTTVAHRRLLV